MNKIFKVVWNASQQCYQAVSEISKSHTSTSSSTQTVVSGTPIIRWSIAAVISVASMQALAAPTDGVVTAGTASISQSGTVTEIHQSTPKAAINWQSFGIQAGETVNFRQPDASSITLNRVIGNEKSVIDGALNANGKVFISNPNGAIIGKNAQINVGTLVATTANISNDDFMNGRYQFHGGSQGAIENLGHISVPEGGVVALIAPIVKNGGTITAPKANVLLASAESFSITLPDNGSFAYTLDKGTLQGLVDNGGAILADGGRVVLTSKGVDTVKKSLIKHSGVIEANTVQNKNGVIELLGDLDHSRLEVSGTLKAEAKAQGDGGFIETSASQLDISEQANISTHAENGKTGTWLISSNKSLNISDNNKQISSKAISNSLNNSNVELKTSAPYWRTWQERNKPADIIVDNEINWSNNILKFNSSDNIYINENLNGNNSAKLWLQYMTNARPNTHYYGGKCTSCFVEGEGDYYIKQGKSISLDEGFNLAINKGDWSANHSHDFKNEDYFKIYVIQEFPEIKMDENGNYFSKFEDEKTNIALGKDIDLSYLKTKKGFQGWENISRLHGLGHKITNLDLDVHKSQNDYHKINVGLFKIIPITRDLDIENGNIQVTNSGSSPINAGLLGGEASYSHIYNVKLSGKVIAESKPNNEKISSSVSVGGIAGQIQATDIENVHVDASLTGTSNNHGVFVGGLSGTTSSPMYYSSSYHTANSSFTGNINAYSKFVDFGDNYPANYSAVAGGFFGNNSFQEVKQSYTKAKVNATSDIGSAYAGGINGNAYHGWLENVYSESDINANSSLVKNPDYNIKNIAYAGGLHGLLDTGSNYSHYFNHVYSSGKLSGISSYKTFMGGLAGKWLWSGVDDPESDKHRLVNIYSPNKNITSFFNKDLAGTGRTIGQDGEERHSDSVKNTNELKQQSTFAGWDFDTVWRIDEGNDYPRLRALTEGTIIVTPTPPTANKTDVGVQAHDLKKVYDGETVSTEEHLRTIATANGYSDIVSVSGLKDGDTLSSLGGLTYGGTWQGAKNAGKYSIVPSGLNGGQKYEIKYGEGSLTIDKRPLTIIAMNNIKPEGENNPDVSRIGVLVDGLVKGEKISNVPLSYSDNKKSQGDISLIRVGEPTFATGLASNYEITKKDGKLLTVQKEYALGDLAKNADYISQVKTSLNAVEDAMLLAKAVYGKDGSKVGSADSFYEVDKDLNLVPYSVNNPNKKFEIVQNDPILGNPLIDLSESGSGLSAALYRKVGSDEYFLVFRGTNQLKDWPTNINQALSNIIDDATYLRAYHFSKNIVEKIQDNKMGKVTIVGHSLGGGLAMYSAGRIGSNIPAITFNTAALGPASRNRVNQNYGNQVPPFEHYIFDNDILSKLIENHPGTRYKVNLLPTNSSIADHLMSHVVKTQRLANLLHENNEIVEKCASNCTKLQEHQWTPAVGQYMPANPNYGSLIRNHIISNIEKEKSWAQNKKGDIVKHPGYVLNPNKPIALLDSAGGRLPTKPISIQKGSGLGQMEFALSTWNVEHNDVVSTLNKPVRIQFTDGSWVELDAYTKIRFEFDDQNDGALIADRIVLISGKILTKGTQK